MCGKTIGFCPLHTDPYPCRRNRIHAPQHHLSQVPSVYEYLAGIMVRSAEEPFAIEKWPPISRQQEDRDNAGLAAVDEEAVVTEAALGGRDGATQLWETAWRGGWFVSPFFASVVTHLANCA